MQICNDADLGTEYSFPQNQNITGKGVSRNLVGIRI